MLDFLSQSFGFSHYFHQFSRFTVCLEDEDDQAMWVCPVVSYGLPIFVVEMHGGTLEVAEEIVRKQSHLGDESASRFWAEVFVEDRRTTKDAFNVIRYARSVAVDEENLVGACSGV